MKNQGVFRIGAAALRSFPILALAILACASASALSASRTGNAGKKAAARPPSYDYGITLARGGDLGRAESVFVSLKPRAPRGRADARSLTNLGNVRLCRGDADGALEYYNTAWRADSADAGILLNRGLAYFFAGQQNEARGDFERATRMAGGPSKAAALLGVRLEDLPAKGERRRTFDLAPVLPEPKAGGRASRALTLRYDDLGTLLNADAGATAAKSSAASKPAGKVLYAVLYWKR